jgi:hypothetical protein
MDNNLHARHGSRERLGLQYVAPDNLDPGMFSQRIRAFGMPGKNAHSMASRKKFPNYFLSHKTSAARNKNHK